MSGERMTAARLETISEVLGPNAPHRLSVDRLDFIAKELLRELDAVRQERDEARKVMGEIRELARVYEDSFAELEAEWPEMGAAIRALAPGGGTITL